jgi:hypothetical protein
VAAKRFPLPKRFNVALSEKAYANLRALNDKYHYGNNYLLTVLLENLDTLVEADAADQVFAAFKEEYGAPAPGKMKKK